MSGLQDYELIAQQLSGLGDKVTRLDEKIGRLHEKVGEVEARMAEIERVNARLEDAALTTSRSLQEISRHWDAVHEALRRRETAHESRK